MSISGFSELAPAKHAQFTFPVYISESESRISRLTKEGPNQ
jgi:hypothetical protein